MKSLRLLRDTSNKKIHAHGGGIIKFKEYYYWYGEDRRKNNYVSIYRSKDLKNWEFRNHILKVDSIQKSISSYNLGLCNKDGQKVNIERPKIIYNKKINKFILWAHYENGKDYNVASVCIATCSSIDGDYEFNGYFRPLGYMSRDLTIFTDEDKNYLISASNDNADLHIYEISEDGLKIEKLISQQFVGEFREAPAMFKKDGIYYLLTSYCTGWIPNQCKYAYSDNLNKPFSKLKNIGNKNTSHSQPTFIINVKNNIIYIGDRWGGLSWKNVDEFDYMQSTYTYTHIIEENHHLRFKD